MGCFIVFWLLVSLVRRFSDLWIESLGVVRVIVFIRVSFSLFLRMG